MFVKMSTILVKVTIIELIEDNIEPIGNETKHVDTLASSSKVEPFEFLSITLPFTPPQIG